MILSPTTIGDDAPGGTGTFQTRLSFGPNFTGGFWSSATPDPAGPRDCDRAGAGAESQRPVASASAEADRVMNPSEMETEGRTGTRVVTPARSRHPRRTATRPTSRPGRPEHHLH